MAKNSHQPTPHANTIVKLGGNLGKEGNVSHFMRRYILNE